MPPMLRSRSTAATVFLLAALLLGCDTTTQTEAPSSSSAAATETAHRARGRIVVANRAAGTLSVIDTGTNAVVATVPLPGPAPEPMYVVYTPAKNRVFVGDRANNHVVAFDARDFSVDGTVPAGGIFHMWADPQSKQLWVVDNVNNALTVIDPKRLTVVTTVPVTGGTPHDVVLDPQGRYAFVSVFADVGPDQVAKYSTQTFAEVGRVDAGADPHVSLARQNGRLYVPSQNANTLFVFDRETLAEVATLDVPGAHGAGMARNGQVFYTTNLPGGGTDGLFAIDTRTNTVIGSTDTPFPVPHNIALTPNGKALYLTHSGGASDAVTVYTMSRRDPVPDYAATVTVGLNPFGIAYVP
ncbi:MAG: YncE family protein [Rhodothermales bacterium]|nr:YncE family protein [Rhodothermales bacterium]